MLHSRISRRVVRRSVAVGIAAVAVLAPPAAAAPGQADGGATPTSTAPPARVRSEKGRIAWVTPSGDVMVARHDGSGATQVGSGAVANAAGLAPLAWRQPGGDAITFVRNDRSLVVAPVDGTPAFVVATDAVVPADSDESIISWQLTGSLLTYLAEPTPGRVESRVVDFTRESEGLAAVSRTIGNPDERDVLAQSFLPLDPVIYQRTRSKETGRELTVAVVSPFDGSIAGLPIGLDDVTFSPDGRYAFAVSGGTGRMEQLVRIDMIRPSPKPLDERSRVCRPAVSPDARWIVYAAGSRCEQVWVSRINGADRRRLTRGIDGVSFATGLFTWTEDGATVTHAACGPGNAPGRCSGEVVDIAVADGTVTRGPEAGSVLREQRSLLRPVTVQVEINGGTKYSGRYEVGSDSVSDLVQEGGAEVVELTLADENEPNRTVQLALARTSGAIWLGGTLRVADGDQRIGFSVIGRVQVGGYGYAKFRGVWLSAAGTPLRSGQVTVTVRR